MTNFENYRGKVCLSTNNYVTHYEAKLIETTRFAMETLEEPQPYQYFNNEELSGSVVKEKEEEDNK